MTKALALLAAFLLGWFAQDAWDAIRKTFTRWQSAPMRRRFPDPWEHEYRRGWWVGLVNGFVIGVVLLAIVWGCMS